MERDVIIEVTSWDWADGGRDRIHTAADEGCGGVVFKATQGIDWTWSHLPEAVRLAKAAGLLVGVIHYADPGVDDPTAEADHLMESLPDDDLPLGLWLELDDLGGRQAFEMGDWVKAWMDYATLPKARSVLMCDRPLLDQMPSALAGRKWVQVGDDEGITQPWAVACHAGEPSDWLWVATGARFYRLLSVRGLNAPEAPADEPVKPSRAKHARKASTVEGEPMAVAAEGADIESQDPEAE